MDPDLKKVDMPQIMNVKNFLILDGCQSTLLMWIVIDCRSHKTKTYCCQVKGMICLVKYFTVCFIDENIFIILFIFFKINF